MPRAVSGLSISLSLMEHGVGLIEIISVLKWFVWTSFTVFKVWRSLVGSVTEGLSLVVDLGSHWRSVTGGCTFLST